MSIKKKLRARSPLGLKTRQPRFPDVLSISCRDCPPFSISLGALSPPLSPGCFPRAYWEEGSVERWMLGWQYVAQAPQPTSPGESKHHWIRVENSRGMCALKVQGILYLCEQGLLLSLAQRAKP